MPLKEFAGAAPATRLNGALAVGTTTSFSVITGGGAGYPSGSTAPFVVVIDRGTSLEEKILVTSRSGDVFSTLTRGYDNTTAQAHSSQAVVEHVLDATTLTETNAHVNTTGRDDHTQYLNTARHAATAHTSAMIQDLTIATADMADAAITYAKLDPSQRWEPGDIKVTARASAPSGWYICDGSAKNRTTDAALFAAIGTAYGAGDGSTTFNLPDMRGRIPVGAGTGTGGGSSGAAGTAPSGGSALTARALGAWTGEEAHVLTGAETGQHNHGISDPTHNHSQNSHGHSDSGHGHGVNDPQHRHGWNGDTSTARYLGYEAGQSVGTVGGGTSTNVRIMDLASTGVSVQTGNANVQGNTATNNAAGTGITTQNNAAAAGHNNVQPQLCFNYMIKA